MHSNTCTLLGLSLSLFKKIIYDRSTYYSLTWPTTSVMNFEVLYLLQYKTVFTVFFLLIFLQKKLPELLFCFYFNGTIKQEMFKKTLTRLCQNFK